MEMLREQYLDCKKKKHISTDYRLVWCENNLSGHRDMLNQYPRTLPSKQWCACLCITQLLSVSFFIRPHSLLTAGQWWDSGALLHIQSISKHSSSHNWLLSTVIFVFTISAISLPLSRPCPHQVLITGKENKHLPWTRKPNEFQKTSRLSHVLCLTSTSLSHSDSRQCFILHHKCSLLITQSGGLFQILLSHTSSIESSYFIDPEGNYEV